MPSAVQYSPLKKKVTALGAVIPPVSTPQVKEIAYEINFPIYGEFPVVKSANAWWMDSKKLVTLFDAYKSGATDEIACFNAGITSGQLRYFKSLHPDFLQVKEAAKNLYVSPFLNTLNTKGKDDLPTVRWVLSSLHPDFKRKVETEPPPLQPTVVVPVQINNNFNEKEIEDAIRSRGDQLVSERAGQGQGTSAQGLESTVQG